ncbi:hypothetical protein [Bdellovibrio sp. HCB288]|uniref:hypothetical protein n=1 Tax=Bdellovibrio sp. HCB288 TaxID=3394355 RepID=UPI0039B50E47
MYETVEVTFSYAGNRDYLDITQITGVIWDALFHKYQIQKIQQVHFKLVSPLFRQGRLEEIDPSQSPQDAAVVLRFTDEENRQRQFVVYSDRTPIVARFPEEFSEDEHFQISKDSVRYSGGYHHPNRLVYLITKMCRAHVVRYLQAIKPQAVQFYIPTYDLVKDPVEEFKFEVRPWGRPRHGFQRYNFTRDGQNYGYGYARFQT